MNRIDTLVLGAGHAGLAVSRLLTAAGHEHLVLERGRVAERWRTERWDSLRLLTPNWMTRLPGWRPDASDPDGFLTASELVAHLVRYADSFGAPVLDGTTVVEVRESATGDGYRVVTDRGTWAARQVVVATGPHGRPLVRPVPAGVHVVTANRYRNPGQLPPGGVLVVGASSSGVQIADELARAGRDVVLSVGRHTRMPRRYRGMDIFWWLHVTGRLARTIDEVPDREAARSEPSMQLVGRAGGSGRPLDLDLLALRRLGVRVVGRLAGVDGDLARFRPDLADTTAAADARMHRVLDDVDRYVERTRLRTEVLPGRRPLPVAVPRAVTSMHLAREGIGTVLFAAGYRPDHSWLRVPVVGPGGHVVQRRGVTAAPGLYVVGQRFQHRRDSGFIGGARHDARAVVQHLLTGSTDGCATRPGTEVAS